MGPVKQTEIGKLIAMLITDGGLYKDRNMIYFDSTSEKLIKFFKDICNNLGITKFVEISRETICVQCYSKELCKKLLDFSPSFRTKACNMFPKCKDPSCISVIINNKPYPPTRLPKFMINSKPRVINEYLKILFSTDGGASLSVSLYKRKFRISRKITFTSTNPIIREQVLKMVQKIGIKAKITGNDIQIKGKEEVKKFSENVGFIPGVKITKKSRKWVGLEKNDLLRKMLISYEMPKQSDNFWNSFNSKEEIYKFLHSL